MMTDPIADMLTRIRNAVRVERPNVDMPTSKVKRGLAEVLKREGYIWDWKEIDGAPMPQLRIELKYGPNGERVIRNVYRSDRLYSGGATALAPDLIIGYARGYRASWETCLGDLEPDYLSDNKLAWSADHCADALEVPGVLFSNAQYACSNRTNSGTDKFRSLFGIHT